MGEMGGPEAGTGDAARKRPAKSGSGSQKGVPDSKPAKSKTPTRASNRSSGGSVLSADAAPKSRIQDAAKRDLSESGLAPPYNELTADTVRAAQTGHRPLVSTIMFVLNGMPHVQRAIRSVLDQGYDNLEFVIQDGGSTDGTVEYIESLKDPRIKLVSEPDKGPADAFAKAMNRCTGDIIASCLYDEELVPGALERAVEIFREHPYLGAITGDAHVTDIWGDAYAKFEGAPFNLLKYLSGEYCPYWCATFFNADALRFVGVFDDRWSKASLEFEVWVRLAMETDILYVPEIFAKYAHHANQLSQSGARVEEEIEARLDIIKTRLFGPKAYFGVDNGRRDALCLLQLINLHRHMWDWNPKAAERVLQRILDAGYLGEYDAHRRANMKLGSADVAVATTQELAPGIVPLAERADSYPVHPSGIPLDEFIIPQNRRAGALYRRLVPKFVRAMLPRDLKIRIARRIGLRK